MEAISTAEPFRFAPERSTGGGAAAPEPSLGGEGLGRRMSGEGIIDQTRREIASIVRETALLARRDQPPATFFAALVDRVARAMAAEGVVVWRIESGCDQPSFVPVARVGRITDRTLRPEQRGCHERMLSEIAHSGQPTVVPATPEAHDAALPANPTEVPAAIVPVAEVDRTDYLLEVFLEPAGGLATQRGYLRFAAQMADLAGEFLRLHRIRQADRTQQRWQRLAAILPTLHRSLDTNATLAAVVDGAAEALPADRVSVCRVHGRRATVVAVSHVERVDRDSPAARHVARLALQGDIRQTWFPNQRGGTQHSGTPTAVPASRVVTDFDPAKVDATESAAAFPIDDPGLAPSPPDDAALFCEAVLPLDIEGHYRLVIQSIDPPDADVGRRDDLLTLAAHAGMALRHARTFGSVPWARAAAALAPASLGLHPWDRNRVIVAAVAAVLLLTAGMMPVPLVVRARGEMRPGSSHYVYAPREGTVTEVMVEHGDEVHAGDLLLRMVDRGLEREYETLLGRRAVLEQRTAELGGALVDQSLRGQRSDSQQLQADQRVIDQERLAIDRQLVMMREERQSLELRSDRDGVIDGWQLRREWTGRPVARGQLLLSVIDPAGPWEVEALIPQSRLDHILDASTSDTQAVGTGYGPAATVVLQAQPDTPLSAELRTLGPSIVSSPGDGPAARAILRVTSNDLPEVQTGAPAEVAITCGKRSLVFVAFQDVIRAVRGRWSMLF